MKIYYTESEGGIFLPATVRSTRGRLLRQLKKFAYKKQAIIKTKSGVKEVASVLFSNNMKYYPILNYYGHLPKFIGSKKYFKRLNSFYNKNFNALENKT